MRRLQVAIVAPSLDILGGQAVQADRLIQAWHDDPMVHAWLVPVNPKPPRPLMFTRRIKYLRTTVTEAIYLPLLLRELARADLVHVFSASYASYLLAPLPAMLVARALGKPVLLNYRSGEAPDHLKRSAIARASIARVDSNIVPSRFLVEVFARFGIGATVVPNVVDTDRFRWRPRRPLRPRLLSTRNFDALYNVSCTLRAFRLVQDRRPDATLTLVGGGREEGRLRRLAAEQRLHGVRFVGRVDPARIASYYDENDIYLQTPDIDNMPTSVIEAFACGLPVVSTDAGGVPALVTHETNGLLARLDDHATIAAHVLRLLDHREFAQTLIGNARSECERYTWSAVRERWLEVYRSVLPSTHHTQTSSITNDRCRTVMRSESVP